MQYMMLCVPNACDGHQQTAQFIVDDILTERIPIADGPKWGRIEAPGLGVEIDEAKLATYHDAYLRAGEYVPYRPAESDRRDLATAHAVFEKGYAYPPGFGRAGVAPTDRSSSPAATSQAPGT